MASSNVTNCFVAGLADETSSQDRDRNPGVTFYWMGLGITKIQGADFSCWHLSDMAQQSLHVCYRGNSGKHRLAASISHFDPKETSKMK